MVIIDVQRRKRIFRSLSALLIIDVIAGLSFIVVAMVMSRRDNGTLDHDLYDAIVFPWVFLSLLVHPLAIVIGALASLHGMIASSGGYAVVFGTASYVGSATSGGPGAAKKQMQCRLERKVARSFAILTVALVATWVPPIVHRFAGMGFSSSVTYSFSLSCLLLIELSFDTMLKDRRRSVSLTSRQSSVAPSRREASEVRLAY